MEITKIEKCKKAKSRYNIYLEGAFAFSLHEDVLLDRGLQMGQKIDGEQAEDLKKYDEKRKALNAAFLFLSYRERSEKEIIDKLKEKDFSEKAIEYVMGKLKDYNYVDDSKFLVDWISARRVSRGKITLRQELLKKGINVEQVDAELKSISKEEEVVLAKDLVNKKTRLKGLTDRNDIYKKIGGFLARKGFDYEIISEVITDKMRKSP